MKTRNSNKPLLLAAREILAQENPMTLRQLFYRLISAGRITNKQSEYKRLGRLLTRARECREIPRSWLVDHVRATIKPSSWSGLSDFGETVRRCYRKNFWSDMPAHVAVFVEKDAIAGTIQPVTEDNDVALHVIRGYASVSFAGEIADQWARIKKPIHGYYLGDFDPSGFDIERDLIDKLARYSGKMHIEPAHFEPDAMEFSWKRLGVVSEDFKDHNLIRLPVKQSDNRSKAFIAAHGRYGAEVDALPPSVLRERVREAIDSHVDVDAWNRLLQVEELEKKTLNNMYRFAPVQ